MTEKPDPFDVAALERSVNDSATRVSTIWVSYLIFALYLLITTGTATHRQLFLEAPVKLPALNIDLPLYSFFVLAPILFVLLHLYVLLQVLLLGRTAAAYNETVDKAIGSAPENAFMRQRLANTLFAQIFAGRRANGWVG
jgi:cytochrome b subunit of formate dehydrogenase